jgi:hypothetical protein
MFSEKTEKLCREVCASLGEGYDYDKMLSAFNLFPSKHAKSIIAYALLCAVVEFKNIAPDGAKWVADYHIGNRKHWTYHLVKADAARPSGFGFSNTNSIYDFTFTFVGSRLCFGDERVERASREELEELYIAYKL